MAGRRKKLIIMILLLWIISVVGCIKKTSDNGNKKEGETIVAPPLISSPEDEIENHMKSMSIEQKVGQLLMPAFRQSAYDEEVDQYIDSMETAIKKYHIGGIVLFKENIKTKNQVQELIDQLQKASEIGLFIAVDEEGGLVSRISSNPEMGYRPIQSAMEIGKTQNKELAYSIGKELGNMLIELGFNMNFAPVADIWSNPNNTVIGTRSFGTSAEIVSDMAVEVMKGLQDGGIISVVKHFPGHGDTLEDTHTGKAFLNLSMEELKNRELIPFERAIENGAEGIMVAHIEMPQIDEGVPASLSYTVITDILKNNMGFEGLIITDALDMAAVTQQFEPGKASLQSFLAGADILLMPDIEPAFNELIEAYKNNIISDERLNGSVYKILKIKKERGI